MERIHLIKPMVFDEEKKYINDAINCNWIAPIGKYVDKLEKDIKEYVKAKDCTVTSSGTTAIHLAIKSCCLPKESIVFVPDTTFISTVDYVKSEGLIPVFIDCDNYYGMSVRYLKEAFEKYPECKCVIVSHLYGFPCDIEEIAKVCKEHNCFLIEDACETLGCYVNGKQTGMFGDYGVYSFNGNKIITGSSGGVLVSNKSLDLARHYKHHCQIDKSDYIHDDLGYNYMFSNLLSAFVCGQLDNIEKRIELKNSVHDEYVRYFKNNNCIEIVNKPDYCESSNYWLNVCRVAKHSRCNADILINYLKSKNIDCRHIWYPLHLQEPFLDCDYIGCDNSMKLYKRSVCIPSSPNMTKEEQDYVCKCIEETIREIDFQGY